MSKRALTIASILLVCLIWVFFFGGQGGQTELAQTLHQWRRQGGNLMELLWDIGRPKVSTEEEAYALVAAMQKLQATPSRFGDGFGSPLLALVGLFQNVENAEARQVLESDGLETLRWWVRQFLDGQPVAPDDVLLGLQVLAEYKQEVDVDLIVEVAKLGVEPGSLIWKEIFQALGDHHPGARQMAMVLKENPPIGYAGIWYLNFCNEEVRSGGLRQHPFDSADGIERLANCLRNEEPAQFQFADTAIDACEFLTVVEASRLVDMACAHPNPLVRVRGFWLKSRHAIKQQELTQEPSHKSSVQLDSVGELIELCKNPVCSTRAQESLAALQLQNLRPVECESEDFRAKVQLSDWLRKHGEYLQPPESLEVFDVRELKWPGETQARSVYLIKYQYSSTAAEGGVGLVGPFVFSLGQQAAELETAEAIYGLYCAWDLMKKNHPQAPRRRSAEAGQNILSQTNAGFEKRISGE